MNIDDQKKFILTQLDIINKSIKSIDAVINYQNEEIIKSEKLISQLQICLIEQNKASALFSKDKEMLLDEKEKFLTFLMSTNIICDHLLCNNNKSPDNIEFTDRRVRTHVKNENMEEGESKRSRSREMDRTKYLKKKGEEIDYDYSIDKRRYFFEKLTHSEDGPRGTKMLKIPQLKHSRIYSIYLKPSDNTVYIGASNGLLLKHTARYTFTYHTKTDRSIDQIELLTNSTSHRTSLIACTSRKILIYSTFGRSPSKVVHMSDIRGLFNDGKIVYVTLMNGAVQTLNDDDWKLGEDITDHDADIRSYFPTAYSVGFALVSLEADRCPTEEQSQSPNKDLLLYRTASKTDLTRRQPIRGPRNIRTVLSVIGDKFLCHSDDTVWLLDSECEVEFTLVFVEGIRLLAQDYDSMAVVDRDNTVHVYSLRCKQCFQRTVRGKITALAIADDDVYIAVDDHVFVINAREDR